MGEIAFFVVWLGVPALVGFAVGRWHVLLLVLAWSVPFVYVVWEDENQGELAGYFAVVFSALQLVAAGIGVGSRKLRRKLAA